MILQIVAVIAIRCTTLQCAVVLHGHSTVEPLCIIIISCTSIVEYAGSCCGLPIVRLWYSDTLGVYAVKFCTGSLPYSISKANKVADIYWKIIRLYHIGIARYTFALHCSPHIIPQTDLE